MQHRNASVGGTPKPRLDTLKCSPTNDQAVNADRPTGEFLRRRAVGECRVRRAEKAAKGTASSGSPEAAICERRFRPAVLHSLNRLSLGPL